MDPVAREKADAILNRVSDARALSAAGKYSDAVTLARAADSEAEALGSGASMAQARLVLGNALLLDGKFEDAESVINDAIMSAEAARLDALAAEGWVSLLYVNVRLARYDAADRVDRHSGSLKRHHDEVLVGLDRDRHQRRVLAVFGQQRHQLSQPGYAGVYLESAQNQAVGVHDRDVVVRLSPVDPAGDAHVPP